ncbi:MAG: cytochrome c3 family protein [Thermodesulfobacteriota bacterium]|nr:cytochrome c3 family protein [Thermodesulfobacteriota bacterium]
MVNAGKQLMTGLGVLLLSAVLAVGCYAMDYPDEVEIDVLANLYEGVVFDHAMHVDATDSCADCHHHTTGTAAANEYCAKCHNGEEEVDVVSCEGCHSADPVSPENLHHPKPGFTYHNDQPNLKAAYHLNCIGCHEEVDGPTGCEDCHAKTEAGHKFYRSGEFAPKESAHSSGH